MGKLLCKAFHGLIRYLVEVMERNEPTAPGTQVCRRRRTDSGGAMNRDEHVLLCLVSPDCNHGVLLPSISLNFGSCVLTLDLFGPGHLF